MESNSAALRACSTGIVLLLEEKSLSVHGVHDTAAVVTKAYAYVNTECIDLHAAGIQRGRLAA